MCTELPSNVLGFHQTRKRFSNEVVKILCASVSERSQGLVSVSTEPRPELLLFGVLPLCVTPSTPVVKALKFAFSARGFTS